MIEVTFSPLFIGEVNVTPDIDSLVAVYPFFQSPIHRGSKCNTVNRRWHRRHQGSFSPLFIGEVNVTSGLCRRPRRRGLFQSPIHRGSKCNPYPPRNTRSTKRSFSPLFIGEVNVTLFGGRFRANHRLSFSPLFIGEVNVTIPYRRRVQHTQHLSVPYSSGK